MHPLQGEPQQAADLIYIVRAGNGAAAGVEDLPLRIHAVVLGHLTRHRLQDHVQLIGRAVGEERVEYAAAVVSHESVQIAEALQDGGEVLERLVSGRAAVLAGQAAQVLHFQRQAGEILLQQPLRPLLDIHVAAGPVGKHHRFVHVAEVIDKVQRPAQQHGADAAHQREEHDGDRDIQLDVHRGLHRDAADHRQVIRAQGPVQLMPRVLHIAVIFICQARAVADLRGDLLGAGPLPARGARRAEYGQQIFLVLLLDRLLTDIDVQLDVLTDELVVGRLLALVLAVLVHVLEDVFRAAVPIARVLIMVIHHLPAALAEVVDQLFQRIGPFLPVLDIQLQVLAVLCQPARQQVDVVRLRAGEDIRVQPGDIIVVQMLVDAVEIVVGISRFHRAEIRVGGPFVQQIVQHLRNGAVQHLRAVEIIVVPFAEHGDAVVLQLFLHVLLGVELAVVFQNGVQHDPGVVLAGVAVADEIHPVCVRRIGGILALFQQRFVALELRLGDHFLHIAAGADRVDAGPVAQVRQGGVDHRGRIDLLHVQRAPVGGIALFGGAVGIADHRRSDVALLSLPVESDRQSAESGQKKDQQTELLQIAQNTEFSHTLLSLSERSARSQARANTARSTAAEQPSDVTSPVRSAKPETSSLKSR